MTEVLTRPELTLPAVEAAWLRAAYEQAEVVLEYGSGGSTVMAAEMGKTVIAVDSDREWAARVGVYISETVPEAKVHWHWADIGPTGDWGRPQRLKNYRHFARYPLQVWDSDGFSQPDVVLIDGRFRLGCLLAVMFRTRAPVSVYFDDYLNRKGYHRIEDWIAPVESRGRMARFEVVPRDIPADRLAEIIDIFGQVA